MSKVCENTGKRILIYSDSGVFKLSAVRRSIMEECNGITRYYGSKWYIETFQWKEGHYVPFRFSGVKYFVGKKKEIIDMLSKSIQFTQAYAEMRGK